jgi:TonB family protein
MQLFAQICFGQEQQKNENLSEKKAESALLPPELLKYVEAEYPEKAFKEGIEGEVLTRITIDATGKVTDVKIEKPAGHGFDEAAAAAIYKFIFTPAKKNGVPVISSVIYRYTFFITEKTAAKKPEKNSVADKKTKNLKELPARLKGAVKDTDEKNVSQAKLLLSRLDEQILSDNDDKEKELVVTSDNDGKFTFTDIKPGSYRVDIVAAGYKPFTVEENLKPGETKELIYRLESETAPYETVVRGRKPPREVTRREITRREITRIPGTGGDALRSIQNLPGMARAPGFSGQLIVRGSSSSDSQYFFDHLPIPMLYHFGGFTSVINSDLLDKIDFYPGNYSVRYGNATGGIVDVYPKSPATDRFHAYVDADLWDISLLAETPIGDKWSIAVAGRRSYIDAILNGVMPDDGGFSFTVAPRYYDYQVVADYHPHKKDNLRLFVFGSDDKMILLFGDAVAGNPNFTGGMNFRTWFHQAQVKWNHKFNKKLSNELNFGLGIWGGDNSLGGQFKFKNDIVPIFFKDELELKATDQFIFRTGLDVQVYWSRWQVISPMKLPLEGETVDPIDGSEHFSTKGEGWFTWPALYTEFEFLPIKRLRIIPGLRLGWFDQINRLGFDPRVAVRYELADNTTLKGGVGLFNQAPQTATADKDFGNPNLKLIKAMHYSIGAEQQLAKNVELSVEGFYKQLLDLVVSTPSADSSASPSQSADSSYNNDGKGKVYGIEILLKHQPTDRFFGWIAYTFMQSTRIDHPGYQPRPFDYDQTHILTIVASAVLGRGWEAGIRFRLVTGNPVTPVKDTTYNADSDMYMPVYGTVNSKRMPTFHQLDVRIDKNWHFKYLKFAVYLDIQNIYNQKNAEGYQYNYDYSDKVYINGIPIFPSIGIKLEY